MGRPIITAIDQDLVVYFRLIDGFSNEPVRQAVFAGVETTFVYHLELIRSRSMWPDKVIKRLSVKRSIKYDPVSDKYTVTRLAGPGQVGQVKTTDEWLEAIELISDVSALKVVPLSALKPGKTYRLRLKAQLLKPELPWALDIFFFWVPLGEVETDWLEVDFKR